MAIDEAQLSAWEANCGCNTDHLPGQCAAHDLVSEVRRLRAEEPGKRFCQLPGCGGWIGPDITGRPMCYRCAPKGRGDVRDRTFRDTRHEIRERCAKVLEAEVTAYDEACRGCEPDDRPGWDWDAVVGKIRALPDEQ